MAQPLSIEDPEAICFLTTRTADSRLWFINDPELEKLILGILARYAELHGAILFAFVLMGNHYHLIARFPNWNRAAFMRDFNAALARLIGRRCKVHGRRSVWARRYSCQVLPRGVDVWNWFYYAALNPVSSGITESTQQYSSYNSFHDSATGTVQSFKYTEWGKYHDRKRHNPAVRIEQFTREYPLQFARLPGFEETPTQEYEQKLRHELLERQNVVVLQRRADGKGFLGMDGVRRTPRGTKPKSTKTSQRHSKRPLCLTLCPETRRKYLEWYFYIRAWYIDASKRYRAGELGVQFPPGTYPPSRGLVRPTAQMAA